MGVHERKVLTATLTPSIGGELLLDDAPGVGRGLGGVEFGGVLELFDVDLRWSLEALPGGLEDPLLLFGEEDLFGLGWGSLLGGRGGHGCLLVFRCLGVWALIEAGGRSVH